MYIYISYIQIYAIQLYSITILIRQFMTLRFMMCKSLYSNCGIGIVSQVILLPWPHPWRTSGYGACDICSKSFLFPLLPPQKKIEREFLSSLIALRIYSPTFTSHNPISNSNFRPFWKGFQNRHLRWSQLRSLSFPQIDSTLWPGRGWWWRLRKPANQPRACW